jgi:hypothetical protein
MASTRTAPRSTSPTTARRASARWRPPMAAEQAEAEVEDVEEAEVEEAEEEEEKD